MTQPDPAPPELRPTPEGDLVRQVRESLSLSARRASRLAGPRKVSETHWRHVEKGYEPKGGMKIPVRASGKALARMAWVVGIDPGRLGEYRPDAAAVLHEILRREGPCEIPPLRAARLNDDVRSAYDDLGDRMAGNGDDGATERPVS